MVALFVFDAEYAGQVRPADDEATEGRDDGATEGQDGEVEGASVDELRYANHCDLALSP